MDKPVCPGCRELWTKLPTLHFCTPQNTHSATSEAVAAEVAPRAGRPDLDSVREFVAYTIGSGFWWSENVPAVRERFEQAMGYFFPLLDYAASLERELGAAREQAKALVGYMQHHPTCDLRMRWASLQDLSCSCGLVAALARGGGGA